MVLVNLFSMHYLSDAMKMSFHSKGVVHPPLMALQVNCCPSSTSAKLLKRHAKAMCMIVCPCLGAQEVGVWQHAPAVMLCSQLLRSLQVQHSSRSKVSCRKSGSLPRECPPQRTGTGVDAMICASLGLAGTANPLDFCALAWCRQCPCLLARICRIQMHRTVREKPGCHIKVAVCRIYMKRELVLNQGLAWPCTQTSSRSNGAQRIMRYLPQHLTPLYAIVKA